MENYQKSPYRWVVLLSMIPALAMTNVFWLTFAPITSIAEKFYAVSPLKIAFLSMSYMIVYIIMAFPASWLVDTKGFRVAIGTGALLTAVFGMLRGVYASNFTLVTIAQLGVAMGQPFLVNSITKAAARWFPIDERATASGIATMAGYLGMVVALVLTPILTTQYGIAQTLLFYGYVAIIFAFVFILFSREYPKTPPGPGEELVNKLNFKDIRELFHNRDFTYLLICLFVLMGIFNAVMTWIEDIVKPKNFSSDQAGFIGGIMVIIGLIGAVVLPTLSDKLRKRRSFLVWPILLAIPGFLGLTFFTDFNLLLISSAIMGFFILGIAPIAFQYGAETAYPVPEGTSYGLLMTTGQISGIIFIFGMDALRQSPSGDMTLSLIILITLMLAVLFLSTKLKESNLISDISENKPSDIVDPSLAVKTLSYSAKQLNNLETRGYISCRIDGTYVAFTPKNQGNELINANDIVIVNINDPSSTENRDFFPEATLHAEIYKNRKEIDCIIHTYFPNAGIVAAFHKDVPPVLDDMAQIIGPSLKISNSVTSDKNSFKSIISALAGRTAVLLADNGAICVGRDMDETLVAYEIVKKSCKVFIESKFLGGGVPINCIEARLMHIYYLKKYSQQKKRKADLGNKSKGTQNVPTTMILANEMALAKRIVCDSGKRLLRSGLVSGTWGNISYRVNEEYMAITPSGREYDLLTPDDIVIVNINDCSYEGTIKPSSEMGLHAEIYKKRKEINSVIHTHSPNASVVAAARKEVYLSLKDELRLIGPSLKIADYALPSTKKLVKSTMIVLEGRNAALLANHGAICTGKNMDEAFATCEVLENSCTSYIESARSRDINA